MTEQTAEQIFKAAWHAADERGEIGGRVTAGLEALRTAGLLVSPPSDDMIEAEATDRWGKFSHTDTRQGAFERDAFVEGARWVVAALTAAGAAPQKQPDHLIPERFVPEWGSEWAAQLADRNARALELARASTGELATWVELILSGEDKGMAPNATGGGA